MCIRDRLFAAVAKWNDYFSALFYLPTRRDLYPLQMALREIVITATADVSSSSNLLDLSESSTVYKKAIEYACIVVSTLPILCIYPFEMCIRDRAYRIFSRTINSLHEHSAIVRTM